MNWPSDDLGVYYCYFCTVELKNLTDNSDIVYIHFKQSPDCYLYKELTRENVPEDLELFCNDVDRLNKLEKDEKKHYNLPIASELFENDKQVYIQIKQEGSSNKVQENAMIEQTVNSKEIIQI